MICCYCFHKDCAAAAAVVAASTTATTTSVFYACFVNGYNDEHEFHINNNDHDDDNDDDKDEDSNNDDDAENDDNINGDDNDTDPGRVRAPVWTRTACSSRPISTQPSTRTNRHGPSLTLTTPSASPPPAPLLRP